MKKHFEIYVLIMIIFLVSLVNFSSKTFGVEQEYQVWTSITSNKAVEPNKEWNIKFSDDVTYESLKNNIYIIEENSQESFPIDLEISEDKRIVKVKHDTGFENGSKYNLYIRKGIISRNSKSSLRRGVKMSFVIEENKKELMFSEMKDSGQFITVITPDINSTNGILTAYEKINGDWKTKFSNIECIIGRNGLSYDKKEGDGKTPIGVFSVGQVFGKLPNPGTKMDYIQTNPNDYWVDDPTSQYYNTWQVGPVSGRWNSAERLYYVKPYDYAFVINYNEEGIPYKGSAIFMHIFKENKSGTAGCVSISKENLEKILLWLDLDKNAKILICPQNSVSEFE